MDTRKKIVDGSDAEELLRSRAGAKPAVKVVVGYFDPLLASHVRRLEKIAGGHKLIALVSSPARPLLPPAARAELVAALDLVESVIVVPPSRLRDLLRLVPAEILSLEQASDAERTEELVRHVRSRQVA